MKSRTDYHLGFWIQYKPNKNYSINYKVVTIESCYKGVFQ